MFEPVSAKVNFPEQERQIRAFWESEGIYSQSLAQRRNARSFVFFEGPPTANGLPHPGHCLTRVVKDIFPRYFTMKGFRCERKAGWDTHGLPVEVEVCKELGIHSKEEIEAFGIEPFNRKCIESVFRYTRQWEEMTRRVGFWVNLPEAYVTYHQSFVESVWWALKTLFEKGLLYQGHKVVWWWAQGGTALSSGEVGEGYRDTDDPSVFIRFPLRDPSSIPGGDDAIKTSLLAWTTTPWTLSSNVALAVREDFTYALVEHQQGESRERFVLAEALIEKTFAGLPIDVKKDLRVVSTFPGSALLSMAYEPVLKVEGVPLGKIDTGIRASFTKDESNEDVLRGSVEQYDRVIASKNVRIWEVDTADFVTLDQGTGIVHIAPAFGEDDYRFAKEKGFGFLQMVKPDGTFRPEQTEVAGRFCKEADKDLIRILKDRGSLLKREVYRHPYPFCPRAENDPLIQYARKSWFIRTTDFKEKFLQNNAKMAWLPEHIREGRFGDFLRNNVDWAISRERFWGTPLPIWQCEKTGKQEALGSFADLLKKPGLQGTNVWDDAKKADPTLPDDLRVHRPYIDAITYESPFSSGARMRRVPEVIDCWFDSGAMPFAQWGYPHQNKERFQDQFPADFISEAIDQTRGWFYSLLAIGTMLSEELGHKDAFPIPFKRCVVLGHMLGEDGKKMSKRLKNYSEPTEIFDTLGADALRWYLLSGQAPWNSIRFSKASIQEAQREFLIRLHNVYSFFVIYANIDRFDPRSMKAPPLAERALLDRWIVGELHQMIGRVTDRLDAFENTTAAASISDFVDALSNWYVRRSRDRFWATGFTADKLAACWTLYECLVALSKVLAPFTPFFADAIYQNLVRSIDPAAPVSVHLADWPASDVGMIDENLATEMGLVREVVSVGRAARTKAKIRVRQPLSRVEVLLADHRLDHVVEQYQDLIAEELNVHLAEVAARAEDYVSFTIKPDLKKLGPRLGKNLPAVKSALAQADPLLIRASLMEKGLCRLAIPGEEIPLSTDDLLVEIAAKPGYSAADSNRVVVVLATEITPALQREGLAREIVHSIQGVRRDLDLAFDDRIELTLSLSSDTASSELTGAILEQATYISNETLAPSFDGSVHSLNQADWQSRLEAISIGTALCETDAGQVLVGVKRIKA
ncbi:isoleucine--tRNA ligase [bacterium]|nr:isoleucine--tRNA ligase [bacterium]